MECFSQYWPYFQNEIEAATLTEMIYFYWVAVGEPSHKMGTGLCGLFPTRMNLFLVHQKTDCAHGQFFDMISLFLLNILLWKLQVDLTVEQVHSE